MKVEVNNNTPPKLRRIVLRRDARVNELPTSSAAPSDPRGSMRRLVRSARVHRSRLNVSFAFVPSHECGQSFIGAGDPPSGPGTAQDILGLCNAGGSIKGWASKANDSTELSRRSGLGACVVQHRSETPGLSAPRL